MRIAQIAPLQVAVPPKGYGGTERVIAEKRFDTSRMTDNYVRLYERLLASQHQPA